jgi:hypothetical protein
MSKIVAIIMINKSQPRYFFISFCVILLKMSFLINCEWFLTFFLFFRNLIICLKKSIEKFFEIIYMKFSCEFFVFVFLLTLERGVLYIVCL